jgi:hypothetical protein
MRREPRAVGAQDVVERRLGLAADVGLAREQDELLAGHHPLVAAGAVSSSALRAAWRALRRCRMTGNVS